MEDKYWRFRDRYSSWDMVFSTLLIAIIACSQEKWQILLSLFLLTIGISLKFIVEQFLEI
jgi:hypothetical protein